MKLSDFDFDLDPRHIAVRPAIPRESARLLKIAGDGLRDLTIGDLAGQFGPGEVLVVNDTKVIPARLEGRLGEGRVEVNLHQRVDEATWKAFARPGRKFREGRIVEFAAGLKAAIVARGGEGEVTLAFDRGGAALMAALAEAGTMPLPPYIARRRPPDRQDESDYQTAFAERPGAVAAPTAGLHLTPALIAALKARGVEIVTVTLHVGAGTFLPVKVEDIADHRMHAEWGEVSAPAAASIAAAKAQGRRVTAVGTTSLRLVETAARPETLAPFSGWTDIFITPGFRFRAIDRLLTNFHLPKSTLFMLVSAFAGLDVMKRAYAHAGAAGYRFYSYGDACLIDRAPS